MDEISLFGIIIRFILGGGAVVCCSIISKKIGSKAGGVFAAFPAVFISALLTLRLDAHGNELILRSITLAKGALVGMLMNIVCAVAVVYFCTKVGWKKGLVHSLIGWLIISLGYAVMIG